jgi:hypothetical protein
MINKPLITRIITLGVLSSVLINIVMNGAFYPSLLKYEAGATMAGIVREKNIPADNIYKLSGGHTWALDFYNQKPVKITSMDRVAEMRDIWVYATDSELEALSKKGLHWEEHYTADQFRITRLQARFLNPDTREQVLRKRHLVHIR